MKTEKKIFIVFILNLLFSIFEFVGGVLTGSIAILSDAIHDFGDASTIGLSYFFEKKSKKQPDNVYTYGYARFSVLSATITTFILIIGSTLVIYHAILRFINPIKINYDYLLILAIIGLIINSLATYFTHGGHSINQKAVNLHMLEDVLGWVVIVVGAIVMRFTNFYYLDPILSIIVAIFILINAFKNLKDVTNIFLIKTPKNINLDSLKQHVLEIEGILDVHHLHFWTLDGERIYSTLHVVVNEYSAKIKNAVKDELKEHEIFHATIEMETLNENCQEKECIIKENKHQKGCCNHNHHH
ncbi:MAG: cation transporter [Clostridia bacterium]|nr:cation transporter [Clostridia bacterium]